MGEENEAVNESINDAKREAVESAVDDVTYDMDDMDIDGNAEGNAQDEDDDDMRTMASGEDDDPDDGEDHELEYADVENYWSRNDDADQTRQPHLSPQRPCQTVFENLRSVDQMRMLRECFKTPEQ
ncbi:hypothetical protein EK21DRAFT_115978 [Setomelanomma holmii]|uniref:Uncharacterized protein n=1 Tax=Setomelanomma holmii TaxID=210430 RepID=A0A9P4LI99_9PLEO|nr:hypothetical protein EK21DRAFT_115978 [Setomelanomma holmii]